MALRQPDGNPGASVMYEGNQLSRPHRDERLQQIQNFLADEDYFRYLDFTKRLDEIEKYIQSLEESQLKYDAETMKEVKLMIDVHKSWIKRATAAATLSFDFPKLNFTNRLHIKEHEARPGLVQDETHDLPYFQKKGWTSAAAPPHFTIDPAKALLENAPFQYTTEMLKLLKTQNWVANEVQRDLSTQHAADVMYVPCPVEANGPVVFLSKERAKEKIIAKSLTLAGVYHVLTLAEKNAPRPLMTSVLINLVDGMSKAHQPQFADPDSLQGRFEHDVLEQPLSDEDVRLLRILAEPSWNSLEISFDQILSPNSPYVYDLETFANAVEESFTSDLWPEADSWVSIGGLLNRIAEITQVTYDHTVAKSYLDIMAVANRIRYDGTESVKKPLLNAHPESRFFSPRLPDRDEIQYNGFGVRGPPLLLDQSIFPVLACRLGRTMRVLKENLENGAFGEEHQRATLLAIDNTIMNPGTSIPPTVQQLVETAETFNTSNKPLTVGVAAQAMQDKILEENNLNWHSRELDQSRIWSFAKGKEPPSEKSFSLKRWPVFLQTLERQKEIRLSGPKIEAPTVKVMTAEEEEHEKARFAEILDPKVRFIKGAAVFPFGETPFQRALLAQRIDMELGDIPELASSSKINGRRAVNTKQVDPFALPSLPSISDPTAMNVTLSAIEKARKLTEVHFEKGL